MFFSPLHFSRTTAKSEIISEKFHEVYIKNFRELQPRNALKFLFSLIFLLILKGWNLQKHCWFTKTSWKFLKNNFLPCFARHFSFVRTRARNMHVLSRERTVCNVKTWRIPPCTCVEKIFPISPSSMLTSSRFCKVSNEDTRTTPGVVLVSLLLTLNLFHTLF